MEQRVVVHVQKRSVGRELRLPRPHELWWLRHLPSVRYLCRGVSAPLIHGRLFCVSKQCCRTDGAVQHQGSVFSKAKVKQIP